MTTQPLRPASPLSRRAGRSRLHVLFILVSFAALLVGGVFLTRWLAEESENIAQSEDKTTPSIEIVNAQSMILREDGKKVFEVSAQRITISPDHHYVDAWKVDKGVMFRDGKPFLQIAADKVRINQQSRDMVATGLVKAHGADGFSLRTKQANWRHFKKILLCPKPVDATLRGVKLTTSTASYDTQKKLLTCPQPVRAVSKDTTFTARSATYDAPNHDLRCVGTVVLKSKNATLRGGDVHVDTNGKTIQMSGPIELRAQPGAEKDLDTLVPLSSPSTASPGNIAPAGKNR